MKSRIYDILKGKFLISEDAFQNWKFILFCALLAILMIGRSHKAERKVHEIAKRQGIVRQLRSEFVDQRQQLMKMKMESNISARMEEEGIMILNTPPQKLIVEY